MTLVNIYTWFYRPNDDGVLCSSLDFDFCWQRYTGSVLFTTNVQMEVKHPDDMNSIFIPTATWIDDKQRSFSLSFPPSSAVSLSLFSKQA